MTLSTAKTPPPSLTTDQVQIVAKISLKMAELGVEATFQQPVGVGPVISVFRFVPRGRTKVSNLENLAADFAVTLGVEDVLVKRMPGESSVGIFVPNAVRQYVQFRDTINDVNRWLSVPQEDGHTAIPLNLGIDHTGKPFIDDLTTLPHLLIAGTTGGGKSTLLSSLLATIVYTLNSRTVKLVLSDTKGVEFTHFRGSPHLLFEPATTVYQTLEKMEFLIDDTEDRLSKIGKAGLRNIHEYNKMALETGKGKLPYIILVIDELADLMMHKGSKEEGGSKMSEQMLAKIVQKSRAAGIYVVAATQRPSVNVVAGSIKANFPARLTFRLPSDADSRTVIGTAGAEHLLSRGDMLYLSGNRPGLTRIHAPYASLTDIKAAVEASIYME